MIEFNNVINKAAAQRSEICGKLGFSYTVHHRINGGEWIPYGWNYSNLRIIELPENLASTVEFKITSFGRMTEPNWRRGNFESRIAGWDKEDHENSSFAVNGKLIPVVGSPFLHRVPIAAPGSGEVVTYSMDLQKGLVSDNGFMFGIHSKFITPAKLPEYDPSYRIFTNTGEDGCLAACQYMIRFGAPS
jgi:hypothetical protein